MNTVPDSKQKPKPLTLHITRVIRARRDRVFEAWVNTDLLRQWFAPGEMKVAAVTSDARVGGTYRIAMAGDNGSGKCINSAVTGKYTEIVPNERLCFTWGWPGNPAPESIVTVEFRDVATGTEVSIQHDRFESQEVLDQHEHGWQGCLDNLEKLNAAPQQPNFTRRVSIKAPRQSVFDAIATPEGVSGWWTTKVTSRAGVGNELRLAFEGLDEHILLRIEEATAPSTLVWTCLEHTDLPEWTGTKMQFHLLEHTPETCELNFIHAGLTPQLECYDHCEIGWHRFLDSLVAFAEIGRGRPFGQ